MGALKINCYCSETQMSNIVKEVTAHLSKYDGYDISDYDNTIDGIRVYVEFESYLDTLHLKTSEILDNDWELLYEDTAVFTSRMKSIVDDYNRENKEGIFQSEEIYKDQLESILS